MQFQTGALLHQTMLAAPEHAVTGMPTITLL
jgi:hypothetical protein